MWTFHSRKHRHYLLCQSAEEAETHTSGTKYMYHMYAHKPPVISAICCALASILHFLTNGGIFLKQEVYIHVKVAGLNAPRHTTHNLRGETGRRSEKRVEREK